MKETIIHKAKGSLLGIFNNKIYYKSKNGHNTNIRCFSLILKEDLFSIKWNNFIISHFLGYKNEVFIRIEKNLYKINEKEKLLCLIDTDVDFSDGNVYLKRDYFLSESNNVFISSDFYSLSTNKKLWSIKTYSKSRFYSFNNFFIISTYGKINKNYRRCSLYGLQRQ